MKRILVDYKKLDRELAALLIETYPDGYGDEDIIAFTNANGELVQAVELRTDDTMYLVKISKSLSNFISNFEDAIEKELETKDSDLVQEPGIELNLDKEQDEENDVDQV